MKITDLDNTTGGRYFLNTKLLPRIAQEVPNKKEVLFIGTDSNWDYKPFFWNPSKLCTFTTVDKAEHLHPDIVANIESCPQIENNRFALIIMIGIYEFLDHIPEAFSELHRILEDDGRLFVAFPGKGYYPDSRGVALSEVTGILKDYRVLETYSIYEGRDEPNSLCVLAEKK